MVMADIHGGSDEKSEFEPAYPTFGRRSSLSPPPSPSPSPASSSPLPTYAGWPRPRGKRVPSATPNSNDVRSHRHREDVLHAVLGTARVTKSTAQSLSLRTQSNNNRSQYSHHYHYDRYDEQSSRTLDHAQSWTRPNPPSLSSSSIRSSSDSAPRSDNRLPSLFDRIKAALETPRRVAVSPPLPSPQQHQPQQHYQGATLAMDHVYHPSSMPHPLYANASRVVDERLVRPHNPLLQPPTLFGVKCTEISQRAYSGQSSEMKKSFDRLQHMDNGKVEYRTIAFCAHLTVTRWEPVIPVTTAAGPPAGEGSATKDPAHAARLMSLANYVRHILSLTNGSSNAQPTRVVQPQQPKQEPQKQPKQEPQKQPKPSSNQEPGPEAASSGPGPIKSESCRGHRYSPDYHGHSRRRRAHLHGEEHHQTRQGQVHAYPSHETVYREKCEEIAPQTQVHQEQQRTHQVNPALTSSHFISQDLSQHPQTSLSQSSLSLLKVPYPNLTLTLALIYVDRLKAKYPEAKGEPGCSHRLFLVAFIIAAKYRCSVELSPPMSQAPNEGAQETDGRDNIYGSSLSLTETPGLTATLEARLNAELIFSNHAWVRLLNLGSFYRQPTAPAVAVPAPATPAAPDQMYTAEPNNGTHSRTASTSTVPQQPSQSNQLPSLASILNSAPASSASSVPATSGILQVEDLDRMEAEFLRFLNFDLAAMSHDLETCWNLLVGKKETPA
ncbi:unnamed protein product [Mortierella alpina]